MPWPQLWSDERLAAALQGLAFFVSVLLLGFAYGHEKVLRRLILQEPDFDRSKAPWTQPDCYARVKIKARDYFPKYWYWGNIRAALVFCLLALLTDLSGASGACRAGELAAGLIAVTNALLFFACKHPTWPSDSGNSES